MTAQPVVEYRYTPAARRRALVLLAVEITIGLVLAALLAFAWRELGVLGVIIGVFLLLILLSSVRAQVGKLNTRCQLWPDRIQLTGLFGSRQIAWDRIEEVRRVRAPSIGGNGRWACTVVARERSGRALPSYLFDHQLEHAEEALQQVVRRTPQARHVNV
jgi:hypothetical protein